MTGERGATAIWWAEDRDAAAHSAVHRAVSPARMTQPKIATVLRLRNATLLLQCDTLPKY